MKTVRASERGGIVTRLIVALALVLLCVLLYLVRHPLMRWAADAWIVEDPLRNADAILLLGDDNFYADRATRAADLIRQGIAPIVVASGRRLRPYAGIAELEERDLFNRGVPKERILRFVHDTDNTREEAQALARLVAEKHWTSVIVVTSNYHTRRARYIFRHILPTAVHVQVASARDGDFDPAKWYEERKSIKRFMAEIVGMVVTMWELRHTRDDHASAQLIVAPFRRPSPYVV